MIESASEAIVRFDNLQKSFGDNNVLRGISNAAHVGDVIGLIGLNGAGKTTLLETALGLCPPTNGKALLFGQESAAHLDESTKKRIGFVPQQDELLENIKGKRYLGLISEFYESWNHALVDRLSTEWEVPLDKAISSLSVGQRQKLSILSALGHEPELIILDEPVAALDPMARRQFLKELVDIASSQTRTIIFSTQIVSDLERVASRVWLMKDGLIEINDDLDNLKERCARIHLPPGIEVPAAFMNQQLIHHRQEQNTHILIFRQFDESQLTELEQQTGTSLEPEWLSLEDIFLEIHQ